MVIRDRTEDIGKLRDKGEQKHYKVDTVRVPSEALFEDDIIADKQRHEDRCYIKLIMINHTSTPSPKPFFNNISKCSKRDYILPYFPNKGKAYMRG